MLRRIQLTVCAAALICVTWAHLPILGVLALVPHILALRGATIRQAVYLGFAFGSLQAAVLSGIAIAGFPLFAALAITYGIFAALFSAAFVALTRSRQGLVMSLQAASIWVLVEWLHTCLPYSASNLLGDSQHSGPFLPLARLGGSYLVSFVMVWLAAAAVAAFEATHPPGRRGLALGVALASAIGLGVLAHLTRPSPGPELTVTAVQGGLPTWLYKKAQTEDTWAKVPEQVYLSLTRSAPAADLTVWPETAVWRYWGDDPAFEKLLQKAQAERGGAFLVGAPRQDDVLAFANTAILLSSGRPPAFADKRRLALLAEIGFSPGHRPGIFDLSATGPRLGVIFCLESVTPHYIREVAQAGAEVVVVLAEGGRFRDTPVARIHADHSVIRAVEVGRAVIHAGQHGYTTLISATGERSPPLPPYTAAITHGAVATHQAATPYLRFGPWILWLAAVTVGLTAARRTHELGGQTTGR